jgi:integrase
VFTLLLKETGCRFGEAFNLRWQDLNIENNLVTITPLKGSNARQIKISAKLTGLLSSLSKKWPMNIFRNPKIDFYRSSRRFRNEYMFQRRRASTKLNQPRLDLISFKSLRHYYACRLYESTKDILFVQRQLGHRSLSNTVRYTRMVNFDTEGSYVAKVARTVEDATALIEAGFEYITDIDGSKMFRKRK